VAKKIRSSRTKTVPEGSENFTQSDLKSSQLVQKMYPIRPFLLWSWVQKLDIYILIAIPASLFRRGY